MEIISEVTELLNSRIACRLVFLKGSDVRLESSPLGKTVLHLEAEKQHPGLYSPDASILPASPATPPYTHHHL